MSSPVRLEVKSYGSSDVELEDWFPENPEDVFFVLDIEIGEEADERADLFYLTVATPEGLRKHSSRAQATSAGPLVLESYTLQELQSKVGGIVERCRRATWKESVEELQKYFEYEYAGYELESG